MIFSMFTKIGLVWNLIIKINQMNQSVLPSLGSLGVALMNSFRSLGVALITTY